MITKEDIQQQFVQAFKTIDPTKPETVSNALLSILGYIASHYSELDAEAKKIAENITSEGSKHLHEVVQAMPESNEKKGLLRQLAVVDGKRIPAATLIAGLNGVPKHQNEKLFAESARIVERNLQRVLDLLEDVAAGSHKGTSGFSRIGLLYLVANETIAALLLAQRSLLNQAYAHIRSIHEHLNLVELFTRFPESLPGWMDAKAGSKSWYALRPSAIRRKLGKPKDDPIYGLLSELGAHGSFEALRLFIGSAEKEGKKRSLEIWLGGCPREDQVIWVHLHLILALQLTLATIYQNFSDRLDKIEAAEIFLAAHADLRQYLSQQLRDLMKDAGVDLTELDKFISGQELFAEKMTAAVKAEKEAKG